ncbi:MAG TPA: hypothetical protein VGI39_05365 [Polyangiaceae bacterium]|jgi:hypothetical protein
MTFHKLSTSLLLPILATACSAPASDGTASAATSPINTHPTTFEEASGSIAQIAALQQKDPNDRVAAQALRDMQPSLDALNHLVARIEPKAGHVVSFYESMPGVIGVSESGPTGEAKILGETEVAGQSKLDLYRKLAGTEPPALLVEAHTRATAQASLAFTERGTGGLVSASSEPSRPTAAGQRSPMLTGSQGPWYVSNGCYEGGDAHACLPDWWNGGWAEYNTKTSFINVAAITGTVYVQGKVQGSVVNLDPVLAGQWLYWYRESPWYCNPGAGGACYSSDYTITDQRWDILQATNQEFDWSYEARWNCMRTRWDAQPATAPEFCPNPQ